MDSKLIFLFLVAYYPWVESSKNGNQEFVPTGNIKKYGCIFNDQSYSLGTEPLSSPSWGDTVRALRISNENEFQELIDRVTKINREVISSHIYNTVDNLLEFFEDYKRFKPFWPRGTKAFVSFYNSYKPKFRAHENFVGMSIDVLDEISNQLSGKWKNISNHIYISSVQIDVPLSKLDPDFLLKDGAPTSKDIKHVMATVKFSLRNRLGYILIDPGYDSNKEIIVMEDGKSPHNEPKSENFGVTQFLVHQRNKDYIWSRHSVSNRKFLHDPTQAEFLVYVGQPFCSFVDTTAKIDLLKNYRVMVKRNSDGWSEGGLFFNALPVKNNPVHRAVTVFTHTKGKKRVSAEISHKAFEGTMSEVQKNISTDTDLFEQVARLLNMTSETLVKKIQQVKDIYDSSSFLEAFQIVKAKIEAGKNDKRSFLGNMFRCH